MPQQTFAQKQEKAVPVIQKKSEVISKLLAVVHHRCHVIILLINIFHHNLSEESVVHSVLRYFITSTCKVSFLPPLFVFVRLL